MKELLYSIEPTDNLYLGGFQVEKTTTDQEIAIIISKRKKDRFEEVSRICYKNIGDEYIHPFLSWYNLIFCSNNYGPAPDYDYMHSAVQNGKKTAATVYLEPDSPAGKKLIRRLPKDCNAMPYGNYMIYVYHIGRLSDYFDFEQIKSIYERYGVYGIDWKAVETYFNKDLAFFGNEADCGFSLQNGCKNEHDIIIGLLLGYPIESTVNLISGF